MKNFSRNEIDMNMAKFERDFTVRQQTMIRAEIFKEEKKKADDLEHAYEKLKQYVGGCLPDLLAGCDTTYSNGMSDEDNERDAVIDFTGDQSIGMFPNMNEKNREYIVNKCVKNFCGEAA